MNKINITSKLLWGKISP